jgi:fructosamine-3-kinase
MLSPKRPTPPQIPPELETMDTVQVPRSWIHDHGWPESYDVLVGLAETSEDGFVHKRRPVGDLLAYAHQANADLAWFREGPRGQANLFVQAWRGPA